jgi:hypothetical protein
VTIPASYAIVPDFFNGLLGMEGVEIFKKQDFVERWDAVAHAQKDSRNSARAALIRRSRNGWRLE